MFLCIVVVFLFVFHSGQANSSVPPLSLSLQPLQPSHCLLACKGLQLTTFWTAANYGTVYTIDVTVILFIFFIFCFLCYFLSGIQRFVFAHADTIGKMSSREIKSYSRIFEVSMRIQDTDPLPQV